MNATVSDMYPLSLALDDGRLDEALADLNSKLTAWSGAISHAQSLLIERLRHEPITSVHPPIHASCSSVQVAEEPTFQETEDSTPELPHDDTTSPAAPIAENPALVSTSPEDEALLATLDPDTVLKVQVLRRLSNYRKSVRELLEKHHISQPASDPGQAKKKSFWRR